MMEVTLLFRTLTASEKAFCVEIPWGVPFSEGKKERT